MPVYVVAQSRIEKPEMLAEYVAKALPTIQASAGRVIAYDETPEVVEGEMPHPRTVMLEFPSNEDFRAWYDSEGYQAILPLRTESSPGTLIVVQGTPAG